jgi:RNA polymerase sigma-70 factor (ECF subfamily)
VPTTPSDVDLLTLLQAGDEDAFVSLVARYQEQMTRLARTFTPSHAVAEEAVQETWLGVVRGVERFDGRSTFKTWLFRVLVNRSITAGVKERRSPQSMDLGPTVDASRFAADGAWVDPPDRWVGEADDRLIAEAWAPVLREALDDLPPRQRQVVVLRDVEALPSTEVCDLLDLSEANQRVLLHRGRARLRAALEDDMRGVTRC